jgi:hypothetical protein
MRKYKFDEYYKKNLPVFSLMRADSSFHDKTIKRKPRADEEWTVFFMLSKKRQEKWIKTGKFVKLSKRKFKIKL